MPIIRPKTRLVTNPDHVVTPYSVPVAVLDERMLTMDDEELIQAMAKYRPKTAFAEGDFVILEGIPDHLRWRETLPRCWKIRFIVTFWAWNLLRITQQYGGAMSLSQAMRVLEAHKQINGGREFRKPMIYAHGYPHGQNNDTCAWLPENMLKRTKIKEKTETWEDIVEEANAPYLGYDPDKVRSRFTLEYAPMNYRNGRNLHHPFRKEEPLVNDLYDWGFEEMLEVPMVVNAPDRVARIDEDHDIYVVDEAPEDQ